MKIFILFFALLFLSCTKYKNNEPKIEYIEEYCPNCKGVGKVKMSTSSRVALGIITFGPGALCDVETCEMCNGKGIIYKRKLNNDN